MKGPIEGCTRCACGAKYWDGDVCHSCGERFRPVHFLPEFGLPYAEETVTERPGRLLVVKTCPACGDAFVADDPKKAGRAYAAHFTVEAEEGR